MMPDGFYTNRSLAGKEIRFTAVSNAFSSLAYVVAGNGCRPSLTETTHDWTKTRSIRGTGFIQGSEIRIAYLLDLAITSETMLHIYTFDLRLDFFSWLANSKRPAGRTAIC